jgi:hypothetical protein
LRDWIDALKNPARILADGLRLALWGAVLILAVQLLRFGRKSMRFRSLSSPIQPAPRLSPPWQTPTRAGEEIPSDPAGVALQTWRNGDAVGALSILYRASLFRVCLRYSIGVGAAATEAECIDATQAQAPPEVSDYFRAVTATWQSVAYARNLPGEPAVQSLCVGYRQHFSGPI